MADIEKQTTKDDENALGKAIQLFKQDDLKRAIAILDDIITRAPQSYQRIEDRDDALYIRYWDQEEFVYDVMRRKDKGVPERSINWMPCVYPKAFYYRGFFAVKDRRFEDALRFLDAGMQLEPDAPLFHLERGKALASLHRYEEALDEYRSVADRGDDIPPTPRAVAYRGIGFQLIELKRFDEAEAAFHTSLKIDPGNKVALNELEYIAHLRKGGPQTFALSTEVNNASPDICARCRKSLAKTGEGSVYSIEGQLYFLCTRCQAKLTKKWWQFWI